MPSQPTKQSPVEPWSTLHPVSPEDGAAVAALRKMVEPQKGMLQGIAARQPFDDIMAHAPSAQGVVYEADTVGGVSGFWCRPPNARPKQALLYLHGGWYVWGSARAYRNFVGQFAVRAGAAAFIPDYRLAPEHPFPAAVLDVQACYRGLVERGTQRIALVGDSAGGGLALALLSLTTSEASGGALPVGAVALSPVTDLTLAGASWESRAKAELYFTRPQAAALRDAYLSGHEAQDPRASPLFGSFVGLPPIRVHVGDAELLLDDSRRYVERAAAAGVDARLDVWQEMPHVFPSAIGQFAAAEKAMSAIGPFLVERFRADAS